ncbi:MAG: hypothetical protein V2A76_14675 [Planctomycetota bacterium]
MNLTELLILLVVAAVCGGIGQSIAGHGRGGCLTSVALGFIGALVGPRIADMFDLPLGWVVVVGDSDFPILWSIIGSALFVALLALVSGRRRRAS